MKWRRQGESFRAAPETTLSRPRLMLVFFCQISLARRPSCPVNTLAHTCQQQRANGPCRRPPFALNSPRYIDVDKLLQKNPKRRIRRNSIAPSFVLSNQAIFEPHLPFTRTLRTTSTFCEQWW
ncbi:hypothetical protein L596_006418 [Steinernema carpocapsae]|uniref:Uncharacterized protein n=1 Tax=Steinernema carpocapsae TaxID=34508 RepID=A0A4U8V289_STECR|nr:hypothetical protein L596_006418 [Steinernema carpocapsae]